MENGGGVVLNLDSAQYYSLNETAAQIWTLLEDGASLKDIAAGLAATLDDPPPDLEVQISEFLEALRQRDLLASAEPSP